MRRVVGWVAGATLVVTTAACTGERPLPGPLQPTAGASSSVPPTAPASPDDPAVTRRTCTAAIGLARDGMKVFNEQLAVLEKAASRGDQTAMVAAAEAINKKFNDMAASLGTLAQESVSPPVKIALTGASAALSDVASETYAGTMVDITKKLAEVAATVTKACA